MWSHPAGDAFCPLAKHYVNQPTFDALDTLRAQRPEGRLIEIRDIGQAQPQAGGAGAHAGQVGGPAQRAHEGRTALTGVYRGAGGTRGFRFAPRRRQIKRAIAQRNTA
ncbi:hypothetical protein GCM10023342_21660 [Modicisalibacter zincidurans]|uniref:Uncharacterized protein n=1 Tax=Modicisalibacter zincidurans TaxID=1178777 RepID=A0ABP9RG55_9GAMM